MNSTHKVETGNFMTCHFVLILLAGNLNFESWIRAQSFTSFCATSCFYSISFTKWACLFYGRKRYNPVLTDTLRNSGVAYPGIGRGGGGGHHDWSKTFGKNNFALNKGKARLVSFMGRGPPLEMGRGWGVGPQTPVWFYPPPPPHNMPLR